MLQIREFVKEDKKNVLAIFDFNTPSFFSINEKEEFVFFLENQIDKYFVLILNEKLIGCGGFIINNDTGVLCWDLIHPEHQRKTFGYKLLEFRLNLLKKNSEIKKIIVRTSQLVYRFYQNKGFVLVETKKDYWDKGFDLYSFEMIV